MFDLETLCDDNFFKNYWKKEIFVWKGVLKDEDSLLNFSIFNEMINTNDFGFEDLRLIRNNSFYNTQKLTHRIGVNHQHKIDKYNVIDNVKLNKILLLNEYSVRFFSITRFLPRLKRFCESIETITFRRCDTIAIYTPKNSACFDWHEDDFEGFAIQLEGQKIWQICHYGETEKDKNYREITLEKGDLLYFPEGIRHNVITRESDSLHITFSLRALELNQMMNTLTHNMKCKLFDYPFRYSSNSFDIDEENTKKYIRAGLMELNSYFSKKSFFHEILSLMLRGTEKSRSFINLPYKELKDTGESDTDRYKFINQDEIQYFPNTADKTCLIFRGRSLIVDASVDEARDLVNNKVHSYIELVNKFNIIDLSDLMAIQMVELI